MPPTKPSSTGPGGPAPPSLSASKKRRVRRKALTDEEDIAILRAIAAVKPYSAPRNMRTEKWQEAADHVVAAIGGAMTTVLCQGRFRNMLTRFELVQQGKNKIEWPKNEELRKLLVAAMATTKGDTTVTKTTKATTTATAATSAAAAIDEGKEGGDQHKRKRARPPRYPEDASSPARRSEAAPQAVKKSKDGGKVTSAMFEAMNQSREEYLNQLRVQTGAQAAAAELGEQPASVAAAGFVKTDLDLSVLRAVAQQKPYDATTEQEATERWSTVAKRVMKDTKLKFTNDAIRDRCEALLADFQAKNGRAVKYMSGNAADDKERLQLLGGINSAYKTQAGESGSITTARHRRTSLETVIEIDDDAEADKDEDDKEDEEDVDDEENPKKRATGEDEEERRKQASASTSTATRSPAKCRRESESTVASEDDTLSQDSNASLDFASDHQPPQRRPRRNWETNDLRAQSSSSGQSAEFQAMLAFMQQQMSDQRKEREREHARRTREQEERKREMNALLEVLSKESEGRKSELVAMVSTMNKEREDRRNEFTVMMNLITKMVDTKTPQQEPQ